MLKELQKCVDALVVVCNENRVVRGAVFLEKYADGAGSPLQECFCCRGFLHRSAFFSWKEDS